MNQNQNQRRRSRRPLPWFQFGLMTMFLVIVVPVFQRTGQAIAQTWDNGYIAQHQLKPIDQAGFGYVDYLGGGVDEYGNYRQAVPAEEAFGVGVEPRSV